MSLNKISKLKRIAILTELVERYYGRRSVVENVKLAKDLANVIDDLNCSKVNFSELAHEFMNFFPEHWKKRTQFLLIVTKYWVEIKKEFNIDDDYGFKRRDDVSLKFAIPPYSQELFQKVSIFRCKSIYDEIDLVIQIIQQTTGGKVSIISPNRDFSKYLTIRLEAEHINYISYCENNNLSLDFMKTIKDSFQNYSEADLVQIARELSDVAISDDDIDYANCNVLVLRPMEIRKMPQDGVVIYTELNETSWNPSEAGYFWLHSLLRKKLGLSREESFIENLFYYGLKISKRAYLLRASQLEGQNSKKSSILAKFEAIAEKGGIQIKSTEAEKIETIPYTDISADNDYRNLIKLPHELNVWDVELLVSDPEAFYVKKFLNLKPMKFDEKKSAIYDNLKKVVRYFFSKQPLDDLLSTLKSLDFFAYQKALNLIDFLGGLSQKGNAKNRISGAMYIPEIGMKLGGYADRIEENGDFSTLVSYQFSASQSKKEIIDEGSSALLSLCLIAKNRGFAGVTMPIRSIQIWNLMAPEKGQIVAKEFQITEENLEAAQKRLITNLKLYAKSATQ